ncbi:MAG TPA: hydroxysqualene dehydroxylase HpnE [Pseudonocardia sp.]
MSGRIGVIGGGLAGITAALRCADAGHRVTLVEARPRLGGLATSFARGQLEIDNGQHVFLRCCTAYRALLERLGVADQVDVQDRLDVPVLTPDGRRARLRRTGLPAPLHLAGALLRYHPLSAVERARAVLAVLALRTVDPDDAATDARSFGAWLAAHGQHERATAALWDLIGVATLNAHAADASLALAAMVFRVGLLTDAAGGDIGRARVPLGRLHDTAAAAALARAGVEVRTATRVRVLEPKPDGWVLRVTDRQAGEADLAVDGVVCAVPPAEAHRLLPPDALALPTGWVEGLGAAPIVNVHLVYDRPVLDVPFAAGLGGPVQWVFDRTHASGLPAVHPPPAQYLAVSISAADAEIGLSTARLRERVVPALAALLPAARDARLLDFFVTREPAATFRSAPGCARLRPQQRTARAGLAVAGAWTATGWPATMEGAVRSGEAAAGAVLDETRPALAAGPALGATA